MGTRKKISPERYAKARMHGATIENAMLQAGYSEACARRGQAQLSQECIAAYEKAACKKLKDLEALGCSITPQAQEAIVRGRLTQNVVEGTDKATQSAKLLGADRRVSMWQPEGMSGVIVIEMPSRGLPPTDNLPVLEGEVVEPKQLPAHVRYTSKEDRDREAQEAYWRATERNRKTLPESQEQTQANEA